uniref:Solute carrier family 12 member 9 n=1 Tax=Setaria digitata TaxID=48799 RepID=A0A915PMG4_9BILA
MQREKETAVREPTDSLFAREQLQSMNNEAWWQKNFLITRPLLFGTWDGVFTTVLVNIFGVIVFLRMGWIVGVAGVVNAVILLIICTSLSLISVFSAIGICERCQIQSGGIYFLVSHILGGQIGGAVGLMYAFGQSAATALVVIGFGESVARFLGIENLLIHKFIAIGALFILTGINMAGVRWVIRLQLILLVFLTLAVIDFYVGALFNVDKENGVGHFSMLRFDANMNPMYDGINCSQYGFIDNHQNSQNFFTVFGVFFANFLGVLAGVNMSDDLKNPHLSIPVGELSAIAVSSIVILTFILLLGSLVNRSYLICDTLIAEKVAFTGFLFLIGLYVSTLSSTIGTLLGTPRVIQSIASEGIIPLLNPLAVGHGANKSPLRASIVMMLIATVLVLFDDLNQLATISTMPFLITYAFVNYSYVSLAMSYDLQTVNKMSSATAKYGSMGQIKNAVESGNGADLKKLFPESDTHDLSVTDDDGQCAIISQPHTWYSIFSNRYISFIGAITNILIILFINFWYALLHLLVLAALYYYIGRVCPSVFPGISQFSLSHMFKTVFSNTEAADVKPFSQVIIPQNTANNPEIETIVTTLNEENSDYSDRKRYHHMEQAGNDFD